MYIGLIGVNKVCAIKTTRTELLIGNSANDHRCVAILITGEVAGSAAVGAIRFVFDRR